MILPNDAIKGQLYCKFYASLKHIDFVNKPILIHFFCLNRYNFATKKNIDQLLSTKTLLSIEVFERCLELIERYKENTYVHINAKRTPY